MKISFSALSAHQNIKKQDGKYVINVMHRDAGGVLQNDFKWIPLEEILADEEITYQMSALS